MEHYSDRDQNRKRSGFPEPRLTATTYFSLSFSYLTHQIFDYQQFNFTQIRLLRVDTWARKSHSTTNLEARCKKIQASYLLRTPPRREALRHSGGDSLLWTSATVTLYLDVELSKERRPGTEQKTSVGAGGGSCSQKHVWSLHNSIQLC